MSLPPGMPGPKAPQDAVPGLNQVSMLCKSCGVRSPVKLVKQGDVFSAHRALASFVVEDGFQTYLSQAVCGKCYAGIKEEEVRLGKLKEEREKSKKEKEAQTIDQKKLDDDLDAQFKRL